MSVQHHTDTPGKWDVNRDELGANGKSVFMNICIIFKYLVCVTFWIF